MKKYWLIYASVLTMFQAGSALAADAPLVPDIKAGEAKVKSVCFACHNVDGNSALGMWPKHAGQQPEYLKKQLHDFKDKKRMDATMYPMAAALSEQDIVNVAAYFAAQQNKPGKADPKLAKIGEQIYREGDEKTGLPACRACHGPAGTGLNLAKFPRLAGQHAEYIKTSLAKFKSGTRTNDPNGMMENIANLMTDEQVNAVSQYLQGLHP